MNKWREHRWKFKSSEPFPDPRWSPEQQLMIGPIPGDMRPRDIESALVFHGPIHWIFIQDNRVWLKKNKERFMKEGKMHRFVKFGYIVMQSYGFCTPVTQRQVLIEINFQAPETL